MAKQKLKPTLKVALYGNFRKGKHLSKFYEIVDIEGETTTKKEYLYYVGIGGVAKFYDISAGFPIHIQVAVVTEDSMTEVLKVFNMKLIEIETSNGLSVKCPVQKTSDLDLAIIREGISNGE